MKSLGVRSMTGSETWLSPRVRVVLGAVEGLRSLCATEASCFSGGAPRAGFTYSHIPSLPPSRPNPLSRYPPNPADASNRFVEFTHTTPHLSFGGTSNARLMFSVHTLAASPYGVLFASSTDSDGVRNVIATSTGPKISTCAIVDDGCTSVNSVGG